MVESRNSNLHCNQRSIDENPASGWPWVLSGYSSFLPQSHSYFGDTKQPIGGRVSVNSCFSLCVSPMIDCQPASPLSNSQDRLHHMFWSLFWTDRYKKGSKHTFCFYCFRVNGSQVDLSGENRGALNIKRTRYISSKLKGE